jgi:hypothetical protein
MTMPIRKIEAAKKGKRSSESRPFSLETSPRTIALPATIGRSSP